ncbi:MAG: hypothetical protein H6668_17685 [Ardenticatenaceae bacterium]|nr:hypothetical protein [Ardenticatenaceae bacterium]
MFSRMNLPADGVVADHHLQLAAHYEMAIRAINPPKIEVGNGRFNLNIPSKK